MKNLINKPLKTAFERIKKFLISLKDFITQEWSDWKTSGPFEKLFTAWVFICTIAIGLVGSTIKLIFIGKIFSFLVFCIGGFLIGSLTGIMVIVLVFILTILSFFLSIIPIYFNLSSRYTKAVGIFWDKAISKI